MDEKTLKLRALRLAKEAAEKTARKRNTEVRREMARNQLEAILPVLINTIKHGTIEQINHSLVATTKIARRTV